MASRGGITPCAWFRSTVLEPVGALQSANKMKQCFSCVSWDLKLLEFIFDNSMVEKQIQFTEITYRSRLFLWIFLHISYGTRGLYIIFAVCALSILLFIFSR